MNSNCLLTFTEVMTEWGSYHSVLLQWFIADTISTETGTTGSGTVDFLLWAWVVYIIYLFQAWTWQLTMFQIYVTLRGRWFVCVCVCVWVYLELLLHFLPFKIHLTNILPILRIWHGQLVLPIEQVENSSTCPTGQVGKKVIVIPCIHVCACVHMCMGHVCVNHLTVVECGWFTGWDRCVCHSHSTI